jgi:hypothetical protein
LTFLRSLASSEANPEKDVLRVFLRASASPRQAASLELHAIPTQTEYPESNRPAKPQGLVHCAVSSLSRPPTSPLFSSFFGRESDETFISDTNI